MERYSLVHNYLVDHAVVTTGGAYVGFASISRALLVMRNSRQKGAELILISSLLVGGRRIGASMVNVYR